MQVSRLILVLHRISHGARQCRWAHVLRVALAVASAICLSAIWVDAAHATCGDHVLVLGSPGVSVYGANSGMSDDSPGTLASDLPLGRSSHSQRPMPCHGPHCKQQTPEAPAPAPPTVRILVHDQLAHLLRSTGAAEPPLLRMLDPFDLRPSDGYRSLIERPPRV